MLDHYYGVIMAGGGGTRLWPLSRKASPKQMLNLIGDRSLFQIAVERVEELFSPDRIYVVTVQEQASALQAQCPQIPAENYLIEPMPRGTASVVGLAAVALQQRDPQATMAVLTADHFIADEAGFRGLLHTAFELAQAGHLVTLGIEPTFPATGFGYIQRGEPLGQFRGRPVYRVLRFREKPDEAAARAMLATGEYSWNSGMFVWRVGDILAEFERQMPALNAELGRIRLAWGTAEQPAVVGQAWSALKSETIDYGIMEGAQRVAVIPAAGLGWNDVGSWDALFDVLDGDDQGNILMRGEHLGVESQGCLVYGSPERLVVTIGVEDLVVVDTGDVLMVCHKDQAQKVRQVVDDLKKRGKNYL